MNCNVRDKKIKAIESGSKIKASKTVPQSGDNDINKIPKLNHQNQLSQQNKKNRRVCEYYRFKCIN